MFLIWLTPRTLGLAVAYKLYKLVEQQVGNSFFDHYRFYDGSDSARNGGHQVYVSQAKAKNLVVTMSLPS